ncbi:MAG: glycoside hydrolase family 127 protein [Bacteroidales bacterium]|nr:MAG: glycoside hydrolase family 127 protein [Bacteroidales bacterium]
MKQNFTEMISKYLVITVLIIVLALKTEAQENDYPIQPVPFTRVNVTDNFWAPKIQINHDVTIPHAFEQSANRILNFEIAAGLKTGSFASQYPFDDTDIYKLIEGASYSLHYFPDPELEEYIDSLITVIGLAQEDDGYLYTIRTIDGDYSHPWIGSRWEEVHDLSHELYNLGHLFESAVAYYQATGKQNLLDIAIKAADLVDNDFGWGKIENYPGHQIVETGLSRLYRATGEEKYLDLAKFFLDVRGPSGPEYCQAHEKVIDQTEAVGHAVRAVYMYAGMADIAALKNDSSYIQAIDKIWEDIVQKKIYVTGGIGASGGNEGFNDAYLLPNSSAYCETCASIGNVYLNHRLFLLHGDARYIDILERTLYNALLSGISLSGDRFFYPNPLLSTGNHERSVWFGCACCPPNVTRLIPSVPGYIYAKTTDSVYINLFISDSAEIEMESDTVEIIQTADYPWDGNIDITVNPSSAKEFTIMTRIPGWARNEAIQGNLYQFHDTSTLAASITINDESIDFNVEKGYAVIRRIWEPGDVISLNLPMPPRKLIADERIAEDRERMAIQRGPIVYCAEGVDNDNDIVTLNYDLETEPETEFDATMLNGIQVVSIHAIQPNGEEGREIKLIPYHLWNNRGRSEMQVWLSVREYSELPDSLIIIDENSGDYATTNYVSPWETLNSIYDLYDPASSGDKGPGAFGNWMSNGGTVGTWNWVQYNFHKNYLISSSDVYWWDDNQGITLPDSSYISYRDPATGNYIRLPVTGASQKNGGIEWDKYNTTNFGPVETNKIRLNFIGYQKAQGILEWMVYSPGEISGGTNRMENSEPFYRIFPNPVQNKVIINVINAPTANISIFDITGRLVYENTLNTKINISKEEIGAKGIYPVKISTPEVNYFDKLVIQ